MKAEWRQDGGPNGLASGYGYARWFCYIDGEFQDLRGAHLANTPEKREQIVHEHHPEITEIIHVDRRQLLLKAAEQVIRAQPRRGPGGIS